MRKIFLIVLVGLALMGCDNPANSNEGDIMTLAGTSWRTYYVSDSIAGKPSLDFHFIDSKNIRIYNYNPD